MPLGNSQSTAPYESIIVINDDELPPDFARTVESENTFGILNHLGGLYTKYGFRMILVFLSRRSNCFLTAYTIPEGHVGIVIAFSKAVDDQGPGLHFKMPFSRMRARIRARDSQ